ncbi:MAG: hypothetical protein DRP25_01395 [Thermotoga sp.]|nr:MAG: hypothetical protein DRP25_01395 [Thermotoga sp.]RLF79387.1 MAG: hypothetical protein DRN32_05135 [Thermococci archaeon]
MEKRDFSNTYILDKVMWILIHYRWSICLYHIMEEIKMARYQDIQNYIMSLINSGYLKPGDKIPSERELAQRFNVSRMTARMALIDLVQKGLLIRKAGKGTFVNELVIEQPLGKLRSFTEEIKSLGHKPGSKLLLLETVKPSLEVAKSLKLSSGTKVLKVVRLRYVDEKIMSLNTSFFPISRFPELLNLDFSSLSIYELIEKKLGLRIVKAKQYLSAVDASASQAKLLQVQKGSALLFLKRITYVMNDIPVEYVEVLFRPDRYTFIIELYR